MAQQILSQDDIDFVNNMLIEAGTLAVALQADCVKENSIISEECSLSETPTIDEKISLLLVSKLESRFGSHTVISEEFLPQESLLGKELIWLVDPIDGTHHYLANDSQYSIMIGLLYEGQPIYGWVYNPALATLYYGGPSQGVRRRSKSLNKVQLLTAPGPLGNGAVRAILGRRDKKNNPWLETLSNTEIIQAGSIGYKLSKILEGEADVLLHLAGRLKLWDTAGPVALALAAGLDVGSKDNDKLLYPQDSFVHPVAIVMGKKGSLQWFRSKVIPLLT